MELKQTRRDTKKRAMMKKKRLLIGKKEKV